MKEFTIEENKYTNPLQYRGLAYTKDINRDTRRLYKHYKKKIGYQLSGTIESMLMRRGQLILMLANAGGGKTYVMLEQMAKLSMVEANENVRYVIAVPNRNQSNQNQKSNTLSQFKAKSVVGTPDGKRKIEINTITDKIFSCVYDKALDVVEILKLAGHEVVLVVDEAHKLIADNNFRGDAIGNLEKATQMADQAIMMTATPRRCLEYYKFTEIYHLIDDEAQNNIDNFRIVLSELGKFTLYNEIKKFLNQKVKVTEVKEYEVYEDTLEVIPPETLLEMLEEAKYRNVRVKTDTYITNEEHEFESKVLVRLNSIKEIDKYMMILNRAGIKCEKLTRDEKDGDVFKSIEEQSRILSEARVIFCTSVVECGVSLENQDIFLIEYIRRAQDFDHDNTIQFFARARKRIGQGVLIIPDYTNIELRKKAKAEAKEKGLKETDLFKKKDFTASRKRVTDEKELKKIESRYDTIKNKFMIDENEFANMDYTVMETKLNMIKARRGEEQARQFLKDEMEVAKLNPSYINVIEADLENLKIYINKKSIVDRAVKEMDKDIIRNKVWMLIDYFEGKIFYDNISIEHCTIIDEIAKDAEVAKKYKDMAKFMSEINKAQKIVKGMKEDEARELLKDEEFTKLLDDIVEGNIYKENIEEYTDKYEIKDILSFKESNIYGEYKKLIKIFSNEEALTLLTTQVIVQKAIDMRYKKAKKENKELTYQEFVNNMNIVPEKNELRYLKGTEINDIMEAKHFITNSNQVGFYKKGLHDKHSTILDIVLPAKTKNGKVVSIRPNKELLFKLNVELVYRKVYKDAKMEKVVKSIVRECEKFNMPVDLYSPVNIKKLEAVYSSDKQDIKMLNEISKVFSVVVDREGYYKINAIQKSFDMASIISRLH